LLQWVQRGGYEDEEEEVVAAKWILEEQTKMERFGAEVNASQEMVEAAASMRMMKRKTKKRRRRRRKRMA